MTTIDQIKKHYDKLTAPERFALMVAAGARGDKGEREALANSAPKVTFEFPHCQGLAEGFDFLTSWHIIQQLGTAGTFYMLIGTGTEKVMTICGEEYTPAEVILLTARRFLEGKEAWRVICDEYHVDGDVLMGMYGDNYAMLLLMTEITIQRFEQSQGGAIELKDLDETINAYRYAIEIERERWAEDKAHTEGNRPNRDNYGHKR